MVIDHLLTGMILQEHLLEKPGRLFFKWSLAHGLKLFRLFSQRVTETPDRNMNHEILARGFNPSEKY